MYRKLIVESISAGNTNISTGITEYKEIWLEQGFLKASDTVNIPIGTNWGTGSSFNAFIRKPDISVETTAWSGTCYFVVCYTK